MTLSVAMYKECVIFVFAFLSEMAYRTAVLRLCVIKSGEKKTAGMFYRENITGILKISKNIENK